MAQLRQDIKLFTERDTAILIIGPEDAKKFATYFAKNDLPFTGLPDPNHSVLKKYGQELKLFKFGRMPAQMLIDKQGIARFVHYGKSMSDIPATDEIVAMLDEINGGSLIANLEVQDA